MHGIPVLVKDNIDVRGMPTTAGAVALEHSFPRDDARSCRRCGEPGAIILGKTNLSEFANFYSSNSDQRLLGARRPGADADRPRPQPERLLVGLRRGGLGRPGGGDDRHRDLRLDRHRRRRAHGIVGLRPTVGLVPRTGIVPISASQDTAGPMTQTVYDAAAELQAIAGRDAEDPATDDAAAPCRTTSRASGRTRSPARGSA